MKLDNNWSVLQDVHDLGEKLEIYRDGFDFDNCSHLISGWEPIDRLAALQVVFSDTPYYGRELRYFNDAPWWYQCSFSLDALPKAAAALLWFESVDYYCKVWLNGKLVGEHEGYFEHFEFPVADLLKEHENKLIVKVWSPWDREILANAEAMRAYSAKREMVKGTYEHADGFIQRDVNPVGICGDVILKINPRAGFCSAWQAQATVSSDLLSGQVSVQAALAGNAQGLTASCRVCDRMGRTVCSESKTLSGEANSVAFSLPLDQPKLWSTWDRGEANLYRVDLTLSDENGMLDCISKQVGFRKAELLRTPDTTQFYLNGEKIYMRGTSYFADIYLSELCYARYYKDLKLIRDAGFNAVRVHVHVERDAFYDICDEMGLAVIQDSDFNWDHPTDDTWVKRAVDVFGSMVSLLRDHPSIICWVALNEPDVWKIFTNGLLEQTPEDEIMLGTICTKLMNELKRLDPDRPYIRASREEDDPESGDSHTYTGSLATGTEYTDIAGTTEKLNTEFGMDVPGCIQGLYKDRRIYRKLAPIAGELEEMERYQYRLLRYYIDHYRSMKYAPCSGYFQFMFIDLCPQSFYGVLDFYGYPKKGYYALMEANRPLGLIARQTASGFRILLVNDYLKSFQGRVAYTVLKDGVCVDSGVFEAQIGADTLQTVGEVACAWDDGCKTDLFLCFTAQDGTLLSENRYEDAFREMKHIKGHSNVLDNELGMRLFMLRDYEARRR